MILVGVDWAEDDHDVTVMDPEGRVLAHARVAEGLDGVARLHALVADHVDDPGEVVVGIEIDRGLLVTSLVAAGYAVYAVNPKAVDRYRDRHAVSGAKSDARDSKTTAGRSASSAKARSGWVAASRAACSRGGSGKPTASKTHQSARSASGHGRRPQATARQGQQPAGGHGDARPRGGSAAQLEPGGCGLGSGAGG